MMVNGDKRLRKKARIWRLLAIWKTPSRVLYVASTFKPPPISLFQKKVTISRKEAAFLLVWIQFENGTEPTQLSAYTPGDAANLLI